MNKNILSIVTSDSLSGGAEKNLSHILKGYEGQGYEVTLVIWNLSKVKTGQWQSLYYYNFVEIEATGLLGLFKLIKLLRKISRKTFVDVTFISNITLASIVGLLIKFNIYKTNNFIVRDPSSPFLRYKSKLKLLSYKLRYFLGYAKVDYLIFQTTLIKDAFYANLPFSTPYKVLGNPIDLNDVVEKGACFIPNIKNPYLVACGRLIHEKGFDILIKSFKELNLYLKYKLVILGDGPLEKELKELAKSLEIEKDIIFQGFIENPMPYFKHAYACVISSRSEGFPNVLYQMMALNSRVLMTKCCGDLENVPNVTFVDPDSKIELKKGLLEILSVDYKTNDSETNKYLCTKSIERYLLEIFNITYNERN